MCLAVRRQDIPRSVVRRRADEMRLNYLAKHVSVVVDELRDRTDDVAHLFRYKLAVGAEVDPMLAQLLEESVGVF